MDFKEQVGEWIDARRDELGMTARDLAERIGIDAKTVNNVQAGRTEPQGKARWEDALLWERYSLTAAYRRGERPSPVEHVPVGSGVDPDALAEVAKQMQAATDAIVALLKQTRPPAEE